MISLCPGIGSLCHLRMPQYKQEPNAREERHRVMRKPRQYGLSGALLKKSPIHLKQLPPQMRKAPDWALGSGDRQGRTPGARGIFPQPYPEWKGNLPQTMYRSCSSKPHQAAIARNRRRGSIRASGKPFWVWTKPEALNTSQTHRSPRTSGRSPLIIHISGCLPIRTSVTIQTRWRSPVFDHRLHLRLSIVGQLFEMRINSAFSNNSRIFRISNQFISMVKLFDNTNFVL